MPACPTSTRASSRSTARRARWVAGRRAAVPSSAAPAAPREAPRLSPAAAAGVAPAISPAAAAEVAPRAARPLPVPAAAPAAVAASKVAAPRAVAGAAAEPPASGAWAQGAAAVAALARRPVALAALVPRLAAGVGAAALRPANTRNRVTDKGGRTSDRPASGFAAMAGLFGGVWQRRHLATRDAAAPGLFGDAPAVGENAAVEQVLDQRRLPQRPVNAGLRF